MKPLLQLLKRPLISVAGFSFFINLLMLVPAIFMLQVFDRVLVSRSTDTLLVLALGAALGLLLMMSLDYIRARLQGVAGNVIADSLAPVVTRLAVAQGARLTGGRSTGESLRDVQSLRSAFSAQGLLAVFDAPWLFVYVAIIWMAHPYLGMTALGAAALMGVLTIVNDWITRKDIEALQRASAGATRYLETSLANAEVVQTLGMTDALLARWQQKNAEVAALQSPTARKSVGMAALTRTLRQAVQVGMLAVGAWLVISNQASPGVTIACTILLGRALAPVEQLVGSWKILAEARAAFRRLSELLGAAAAQEPRMELPAPRGQLLAQQLAFRAPVGERILLAGVSLQLEPGESLAIVGPSGAGKSTLLRLLTGIWQPTAGVVRLDGFDLSQWPREQIGPWLGYVPQDVELFAGTVADNIARLGLPDPAKVVQAAQRARVHEMIQSLPQGYDTMIDPASALLSPGQRQRIALARALYGDPKLLVLDEPNSNLDGAGEAALAEALKALRGQVTVVVVTHRSALVQHVDKMLVIEAGKAQHYGTVAEVMKALQGKSQVSGASVMPMPVAVPVIEKASA
ncbi:type I secretion system permease/ATPase [Ramlibacter sp. AW1]|uniref:Type I secretion system permease/ATPase n=1 Tax=Ramlibacter aurantiacus TaxID=2801330 RepID=A0A937D3L4_9BURK|nr:type I secretion system permease/ATPase [Ramlibacter aurantiacus]MBL0422809.1 type I secretion system permease/ATPase [Ramlibacter aurantiacus]